MFLWKVILKICSKFTGEHPCWSVISITMLSSFIVIALWHGCSPLNLLHIFRTPFPKNTSKQLLLFCCSVSTQSTMLRSPRPPSILGVYSLSVSLCEWYILFIVTIFRFSLFLSITFSSSFVHLNIPALYRTMDISWEFITLNVFPPFSFDDFSCLILL